METLQSSTAARKPESKWRRVLVALLTRPMLGRFEAERDRAIADHTLPSTISELQRKGLRIDRRIVKRPGFGGGVAMVAEYSLPGHQRAAAEQLLARGGDVAP